MEMWIKPGPTTGPQETLLDPTSDASQSELSVRFCAGAVEVHHYRVSQPGFRHLETLRKLS